MKPSLESFTGCLIGTAVGDSVGLPREGINRAAALRRWGPAPFRHSLVFGRGLISDDTEHACMTAQALLVASHEVDINADRFARSLAWRLRWWLVGLPGGTGLATARAILRLWIGFSPARSGVNSAGNGPAMRSPLLGLVASSTEHCTQLVIASTRITHNDPRAIEGALILAHAARLGAAGSADALTPDLIDQLLVHISGEELARHLRAAKAMLIESKSAQEYANSLGLDRGVTGYINHTAPVAIYCWLRHPRDFRAALESALALGGDTDTVGAIVGALAGTTLGERAIPNEWIDGIADWPRSVGWIRQVASQLHARAAPPSEASFPRAVSLFWPAIPVRNLVFLVIVIAHGFRRLWPC